MFEIAYLTKRGIPESNEDRVFVNGNVFDDANDTIQAEHCVSAVCDGVGGQAFGEIAAIIACEVMKEYTYIPFTKNTIFEYVGKVNERINAKRAADSAYLNMATTIAAVYLDDERACVFNLGDSEVLRFNSGFLTRLSEKHSLNEVFPVDTKGKAPSHIITRCIDGNDSQPYVFECEACFDDVYLIFSDGVGDVLSRRELKQILLSEKTLQKMCEDVYKLATDKGSDDNISVIIIRSY